MENYKHRPKINPKIIFNNINKEVRSVLIIGNDNSDVLELLKFKNIPNKEFLEIKEINIINFLLDQEDNKFDLIIFNLELSNFFKIKQIIELLLKKGSRVVIRFRNKNHGKHKTTKRKIINQIIKKDKITILEKIYSKYNFFSECFLFKPFAYYTVYFITKNDLALNFELSFFNKLKKIIFLKREAKLIINKK